MSAPASAKDSMWRSGRSTIRWQSSSPPRSWTRSWSARTTSGPIVIGGTKCPSMTSTCKMRAPASMTASTSSPRRRKSAESSDGTTWGVRRLSEAGWSASGARWEEGTSVSLRRDPLPVLRPDALEELLERLRELLDALALERLGDVVVVDACLRDLLEDALRLVDALFERWGHSPVVLEGPDRLLGHRVHRLGADELLDVEDVRVGGILRRGRGPEAALGPRPLRAEEFPALAREGLLVALVRELGIGDGELPLEVVVAAELVQAAVGLGIDTGDEEARNRGHRAGVAAGGDEPLEPAQVGLGVEGEVRVDLDRRVAVPTRALVPDRPQKVAGVCDVLGSETDEDLFRLGLRFE